MLLAAAFLAGAVYVLGLPMVKRARLLDPPRAPITQPTSPPLPDTGHPAPREVEPEIVHPGEEVTVELMEPPAERYADPPRSGPDLGYAATVEEIGRREVDYDPLLGRAARELANQQSRFGGTVPTDVLDFILRSAGAVDRTVLQGYTLTSTSEMGETRKYIERSLGPPGGEPARVGAGEVYIPGARMPRVLGVLVSRTELEVSPAPRRVEPGEAWELTGTLPGRFTDPSALVLRQNGKLEELAVTSTGRRFHLTVTTDNEPGTLIVSLSAVGPHGPLPLVQLPVEVGRPLPDTYTTHMPPDESDLRTPATAEALAFRLLNQDRARFGVPPLARDPALDVIARAHSADMRDNHFFGHVSPTTRSPSDRIAAARYRASRHAENVALSGSIHGGESALLASLPHRRNIVAPELTHVGIGVAAAPEGSRPEWRITQLFATPAITIDPTVEARRLEETIAALRREAGARPLERDSGLDRIAAGHARVVSAGQTRDDILRMLGDAERAGLTRGDSRGWAAIAPGLADLELPSMVTGTGYGRMGIAVHQPPDDPHGSVRVVLVLTGPDGR